MASTISLFEGGLMLIGNSAVGDGLTVSSSPIGGVEVLSMGHPVLFKNYLFYFCILCFIVIKNSDYKQLAPLFSCFFVPRSFMSFSCAICRLHQSGVVYKFSLVLITHTFKSETPLSSVTLLFPFLSIQVSSVHFTCCKKGHFSTHALNIDELSFVVSQMSTFVVWL
jgi:hypothetical protein